MTLNPKLANSACSGLTCYSLIETAKANHLELYAYLEFVLNHIAAANPPEKVAALLPWNVPLADLEKNMKVFSRGNRRI